MHDQMNVRFFPVVYQWALPVSDNTIIHQLEDIHILEANKD